MSNEANDQPPAYSDEVRSEELPKDAKSAPAVQSPPTMNAGPSYVPYTSTSSSVNPVVYHYDNPLTGEHVVSLLPPSHPEMVCLQAGEHVLQTSYGWLGILAAVFWFPLGVGLCLLDRRVKCARCGRTIEENMCS
ncbi:hypothetical protein MSAN_00054200 [Mycena sanguinolenta]|uniref:Brain protein I3 n=1 Tax=Mycena sanguinolenta TaxID=230812 RepID=A0A8H6ZFD0_9AGAR|nr:hypothetical protein MSAN_00054200 [Mycena sanguinolenta]